MTAAVADAADQPTAPCPRGAVLLGRWKSGTPEWHAARANGLGGSEAAAAVGLSPFESPFSLWHRKAGFVGPVEATDEMEWGSLLEAGIVAKFLRRFPHLSIEGIDNAGTWCPPDRPWMIANPDRLLYTRRPGGDVDLAYVLETKYSLQGDGYGEEGIDHDPPGTGRIPIHVRCQVMWYLDVLGLPEAYVAVFVGAYGALQVYRVLYNPTEARQLRDAARRFLDTIEADQRPAIDGHAQTYLVIREMHPQINGETVELDGPLADRYRQAKTDEKRTADVARQVTAEVADAMGFARMAVGDDGKALARRQAKGAGIPYVVAARGVADSAPTPLITLATPTPTPAGEPAGRTWTDPDGGEDF